MDFSIDSKYLQTTSGSGACELFFWDCLSGQRIQSATQMRDVKWATLRCVLGWPVQVSYIIVCILQVIFDSTTLLLFYCYLLVIYITNVHNHYLILIIISVTHKRQCFLFTILGHLADKCGFFVRKLRGSFLGFEVLGQWR